MGFVDDGERETVHLLSIQPLPARQSGLQRPTNLPLAHRVVEVLTVHQRGIRSEHDHRPGSSPGASWIAFVVLRTPSAPSTGSFSSEHTATIGARCPTARHAWAVCTSRSRVGTVTRIRPPGKHSSALAAAVIVLPDPVADTSVPRAPCSRTEDLAKNLTHSRMAFFWVT